MKKIILLGFLFLGIGSGLVLAQYLFPGDVETSKAKGTASIIAVPPVKEKRLGAPVALSVPKLNLSGIAVEHVGMDYDGKMSVPSSDENVAWFELGYKPGARGSAVIAGHYDRVTGEPAVFYHLNSMESGDIIHLENSNGDIQTFEVIDKTAYPSDDFPTDIVFGKSDKKMLNLITCDGTWDSNARNYSNRLVIFSQLVE